MTENHQAAGGAGAGCARFAIDRFHVAQVAGGVPNRLRRSRPRPRALGPEWPASTEALWIGAAARRDPSADSREGRPPTPRLHPMKGVISAPRRVAGAPPPPKSMLAQAQAPAAKALTDLVRTAWSLRASVVCCDCRGLAENARRVADHEARLWQIRFTWPSLNRPTTRERHRAPGCAAATSLRYHCPCNPAANGELRICGRLSTSLAEHPPQMMAPVGFAPLRLASFSHHARCRLRLRLQARGPCRGPSTPFESARNAVIPGAYYQSRKSRRGRFHRRFPWSFSRRLAANGPPQVIVFCGVHFRPNRQDSSAPPKLVLLAGIWRRACSLATPAPPDAFAAFRAEAPRPPGGELHQTAG